MKKDNPPAPNADYDSTEEIYLLQHRHNIKATFKHVKGHLDNKHDIATLAQEERMNVEADALATLYYKKGQPSSTKCSLTESSPIQLHIRGHTITSNYDREINRAYLEPNYMAKLQEKFEWNESTIQSISWNSLRIAIKRIARTVLTTKICND